VSGAIIWRLVPAVRNSPVMPALAATLRNECGFTQIDGGAMESDNRLIPALVPQNQPATQRSSPEEVDAYFVAKATGRWSRVSMANTASALRGFLRCAAERGMCTDRLAALICRPRLYRQESLPYAPDWFDVQRMWADAETDKPRDIRDRAILLLLAVYGSAAAKWRHCVPRSDRLGRWDAAALSFA
jgi:site-specific recombinase XerC